MPIIICPGIHDPELTDFLAQNLSDLVEDRYFILPTANVTPYSTIAISQWLDRQPIAQTEPLSFIAFSAGVVGSIGAAISWQLRGGHIGCFIAFDGWGMPLIGNFPIYRVSHDYFTHWSSSLLGAGTGGFYADPEVGHLDLWRSLNNIYGWRAISPGCKTRTSAIDYLTEVLNSLK